MKSNRAIYIIILNLLLIGFIPIISAEDSFGFESNENQFWNKVNQNTEWILEYNKSGNWIDSTEYLNVIKNYSLYNCKISLEFTAPKTGDYKLTFLIDKKAKEYLYKQNKYTYYLNYTWEGINYSLYFNFTDIANIPNIEIDHGLNGQYFYFSAIKRNVPKDKYIFLDPKFGAIGSTVGGTNIKNDMYGLLIDNISPSNGYTEYIEVKLDNIAAGCAIKCAIYDNLGNLLTFGETEQRIFHTGTTRWAWHRFNFTRPTYISGWGAFYILAVMANDTANIGFINAFPSNDYTFFDLNINYPPNFPDPFTFDGFNLGKYFGIRCFYVNDGVIKITNFTQQTDLINLTLDIYSCDTFDLSVDINHTYASISMDSDIYIDGEYLFTETGHYNTTIIFDALDYFDLLSFGNHNLTINVTDEDGNYNNKTYMFQINVSIVGNVSLLVESEQFLIIIGLVLFCFFIYTGEKSERKDHLGRALCFLSVAIIGLFLGVYVDQLLEWWISFLLISLAGFYAFRGFINLGVLKQIT